MTHKEKRSCAKNQAKAQIACYERFGNDSISIEYGLHGIGIALGSKTNDPEDGVPAIIDHYLKNLKDLSKEWLSILKENSKRISKEKWNREIKLEDLSKRLNLSRDKTIIFIKFFRDEEYNCRVILGDIININYINKGYMDKTYSNLYI